MTANDKKPLHPSIARLYAIAKDHDDQAPAEVARTINVSDQTLHNWEKRGISKDGANKAGRAYGCDPLAILDGPLPKAADVQTIFTKEQYVEGDAIALQIALRSLLVAVLDRTPGAAEVFVEQLGQLADAEGFSAAKGYLGQLAGTARAIHRIEEGAAQARRRAGSVVNTKRKT